MSPKLSTKGSRIAAIDRERVFERFTRLDDAERRAFSGSGLGLWIVRQVVGRHSGRVWVESEPGAWTRFLVLLPRAQREVGSEAPSALAPDGLAARPASSRRSSL